MEAGLFDVPFSRIEDVSGNQAPWVNATAPDKVDGKFVTIAETKHSKVKERKRYSQKLAKQLQNIGIDVDVDSGVEYKSVTESGAPEEVVNVNNHSGIGQSSTTGSKEILENIADETLMALEASSAGMDSTEDNESLSGWDPMKASYEQKSFNSYRAQRYDDNFLEKHTPIHGPDGRRHISPTKHSSDDVRLYIGNIPRSLTEDGMRNMFSSVGKCRDVKKCKIREGEETTFGFVTFTSVKEAEAAICKYDGFPFGSDSKLRVKLARNHNPASHEEFIWGRSNHGNDKADVSESFNWEVTESFEHKTSKQKEYCGSNLKEENVWKDDASDHHKDGIAIYEVTVLGN